MATNFNLFAWKEHDHDDLIIGETYKDAVGVEVDFQAKTFKRLLAAVGKTPGADFNTTNAFGGRRRCCITDDGVVLAYHGQTGYTDHGKTTVAITKNGVIYPVGTNVQAMVEQPKFYYKVVPIKMDPIVYYETWTLTVNTAVTTTGNITVVNEGVTTTVSVTAGDTAATVANAIKTKGVTGWTLTVSGAVVTFVAANTGEKGAITFGAGATGVTVTVAKTISGKESKGHHLRKARYYVSDKMLDGFKLHPAFVRKGKTKEFIYFSAYEGCAYNITTQAYIATDAQSVNFSVGEEGYKLSSVAGVKPMSGLSQTLTRANARILANNRGIGWEQLNISSVSATQLLMLLEYATFDLQSTNLGFGYTTLTDDGTTNMAINTGSTSGLGNNSGSVLVAGNHSTMTYRGEENFWGNIWKFMDGMNPTMDGYFYPNVSNDYYGDSSSDHNYKRVDMVMSRNTGYITAFGYSEQFDSLFLTSETDPVYANSIGDNFHQAHLYKGDYTTRFGGRWTEIKSYGPFTIYVDNAITLSSRQVGARLVYIPDNADTAEVVENFGNAAFNTTPYSGGSMVGKSTMINHGLTGITSGVDYVVHVTPSYHNVENGTSTPSDTDTGGGSVGDIFVRKTTNAFYVANTGDYNGYFDWVAYRIKR